jgi:hypothetical protein
MPAAAEVVLTADEVAEVAAGLRRLLGRVDEGEMEASALERAYVAGAAGALEQLVAGHPFQ